MTNYAPFMREAIALAQQGRFATCPNPTVGAVLVKDGEIVARGWHHRAGEAHAEVDCLRDARERGINPAECTIVVTLEPCNHTGKTPPCSEAILAAGIKRVVFGLADPNPVAAGGAERLRSAGVEVIGPVCEEECRDLVADFLLWQQEKRPYVILKMASTLDGRIATRTGHSQWISCEASRQKTHLLRAGVGLAGGAVLVGGNTFKQDNPQLTSRIGGAGADNEGRPARQPLACVLTSHLPKPDSAMHLIRERAGETVFFCPPAVAASTDARALQQLGVRVMPVPPAVRGKIDIHHMMLCLRQELGCPYVLCEGGGGLAMSLLDWGYVDEFHLHLAPLLLCDNSARPIFNGAEPQTIGEGFGLRVCATGMCGDDVHVLLRRKACSQA